LPQEHYHIHNNLFIRLHTLKTKVVKQMNKNKINMYNIHECQATLRAVCVHSSNPHSDPARWAALLHPTTYRRAKRGTRRWSDCPRAGLLNLGCSSPRS
jgi:hypothetical protein